jgi:hypothetical protein
MKKKNKKKKPTSHQHTNHQHLRQCVPVKLAFLGAHLVLQLFNYDTGSPSRYSRGFTDICKQMVTKVDHMRALELGQLVELRQIALDVNFAALKLGHLLPFDMVVLDIQGPEWPSRFEKKVWFTALRDNDVEGVGPVLVLKLIEVGEGGLGGGVVEETATQRHQKKSAKSSSTKKSRLKQKRTNK